MIDVPVLHHILLTRLILALLEGQADEQQQPYSMQGFWCVINSEKQEQRFFFMKTFLKILRFLDNNFKVNALRFRTE